MHGFFEVPAFFLFICPREPLVANVGQLGHDAKARTATVAGK
jgi:hypothetical protein